MSIRKVTSDNLAWQRMVLFVSIIPVACAVVSSNAATCLHLTLQICQQVKLALYRGINTPTLSWWTKGSSFERFSSLSAVSIFICFGSLDVLYWEVGYVVSLGASLFLHVVTGIHRWRQLGFLWLKYVKYVQIPLNRQQFEERYLLVELSSLYCHLILLLQA